MDAEVGWHKVKPEDMPFVIAGHFIVGEPPGPLCCRFCGISFRRWVSADETGVAWLWNGKGQWICRTVKGRYGY